MFCKNCGTELDDQTTVCPNCGADQKEHQAQPAPEQPAPQPAAPQYQQPPQQPYYQQPAPQPADKKVNGLGIAGFIVALLSFGLGILFAIAPIISLALSAAGVGLRKRYTNCNGLAIAGLVIGIITTVIWGIVWISVGAVIGELIGIANDLAFVAAL